MITPSMSTSEAPDTGHQAQARVVGPIEVPAVVALVCVSLVLRRPSAATPPVLATPPAGH